MTMLMELGETCGMDLNDCSNMKDAGIANDHILIGGHSSSSITRHDFPYSRLGYMLGYETIGSMGNCLQCARRSEYAQGRQEYGDLYPDKVHDCPLVEAT